jgi:hypothetical protein
LVADRDLPAFRAVLDSFEPDGFDLDLDELFESGLSYLLDGFQRATEMRFESSQGISATTTAQSRHAG